MSKIKIEEEKFQEYVALANDYTLFTATESLKTMLPSPITIKDYEYANNIQTKWNELLSRCSNNYDFLYKSLKG